MQEDTRIRSSSFCVLARLPPTWSISEDGGGGGGGLPSPDRGACGWILKFDGGGSRRGERWRRSRDGSTTTTGNESEKDGRNRVVGKEERSEERRANGGG